MRPRRALAALAAGALLALAACGDDTEDVAGDSGTTVPSTEAPSSTSTSTSAPAQTTSTTAASDDVAADALAAAEAWVATFLPDTAPTLSEFRQGDSRSGEVEVFRPAEGGGQGPTASTLLLRLDDSDEWQVFAAVNDTITIDEPAQDGRVPAGPLTVAGAGRGFEATIVARAFDGATGEVLAEGFGMGGALETPEPYEITLDLSGAQAGTPVVLVVSGGTGLETDTGEFSAIRLSVG